MIKPATIYALSSGRPPAAIAVIRLSGPRAGDALRALIGRLPEPRRAALAEVRDPASGEPIDQGLALWFPGPRSETGEDVAELQLHGGQAVIAATFAALQQCDGLRLAEPGEFTRRAFEAGRLGLTEVEGLADLIAAGTEVQRRHALRQLKGLLGDRAEEWRRRLTEALALIEAGIDFSDEGDVPDDMLAPALAAAAELRDEIGTVLAEARHGERLRDGLVVAIAGPPNAGKSTLLNRIARREVAIVSPHAGTTRDIIEVNLDLEGYPVTLLDTAGIRESDDPVEQEGVRRALARAAEADLVLWVAEDDSPPPASAAPLWRVRNKIDRQDQSAATERTGQFLISAKDGTGVSALLVALAGFARPFFAQSESGLISRQRHRLLLQDTHAALLRALGQIGHGREELIAEELRLAASALGRLVGRIDVEDVLDVVFRDFCIGK